MTLLIAVAVNASAARVAGIDVAEGVTVGASGLVLNGCGLRKKLIFKVYVVGLYVTERRQSSADLLGLAGPKRVSITLLRTLPARKLVDALEDGVRRNSSLEQYQAVAGRLEELYGRMLLTLDGTRGDIVTFDWLPEKGTVVIVNGAARGQPIPGDDLYVALLKVWLGEHPESGGLKKSLLGLAD